MLPDLTSLSLLVGTTVHSCLKVPLKSHKLNPFMSRYIATYTWVKIQFVKLIY